MLLLKGDDGLFTPLFATAPVDLSGGSGVSVLPGSASLQGGMILSWDSHSF